MPLTDQLNPFHLRLLPGSDSTSRDTLTDEKRVQKSLNTRYDPEVGSVIKAPQRAYYNGATMGSDEVHSLYRYYTTTSKFVLAASGSVMYVSTDGTMTSLKAGFTSGEPFTFVTYKNLCMYSNGFENVQVTDGTLSWELGSCAATLQASAGNVTAGVHYYAVTLDDDAYVCGAESNSITAVSSTHQQVELSSIPLGPIGTTNRKIYRTEAGGSTLKLLATIADNTTTTYTDNIADGSLGADMPTVTDDMPKGKYLEIIRERLMIAANTANPNRIWYANAYLPGYIQADSNGDYLDIAENDGDVIVGIPPFLGLMTVFKRNNIRRVNMDNADPDKWFVDDPISYNGCVAPRSIAVTSYGILYLGWDHFYNFDGASSKPIIDQFSVVSDSFTQDSYIKADSLGSAVGFWYQNDYLVAYISGEGGTDYHDKLLRYHYLRDQISIDTVEVTSFAAFKGSTDAGELYYGDSRQGFVYLAENYDQLVALATKTKLNHNDAYPGTLASGLDDIYLGGTEDSPTIEIGWATRIDDAVGDIDTGYSGTAIIDRPDTDGTYTSEIFQISASGLGKIYWNEQLGAGDDIQFYTRTGATTTACAAASWDGPLSESNGSSITSTANTYFQFKADLTAGVITQTPVISKKSGFVIKFTYTPGGTTVTDPTYFYFGTGRKNFGLPHVDKLYKKITVCAEGVGEYTVEWETDLGETGSWTVDLAVHPRRFEAFFPDNAYGRWVKFNIIKSDTENFILKEIMGLWAPRPVL